MNQTILDFRSDTVTKPTPAMLEAMMTAKVGDDVFGDDPTVNALEQKAASMFGMEAALFCASGTMTNQIAIKVHTKPGDEVICDHLAHIYHYEGGGIAVNSGCAVQLLDTKSGQFTADQVRSVIKPDDIHSPVSKLVAIENTCNKGGGSIWNSDQIDEIRNLCDEKNLKLHLDGARLFNALVETGQSTQAVGKQFDSISICLSKGLGCPVGSLVLGNAAFIKQARRVRKVFGGGMRQAGFLAAAGIYALDNHVDRLKKDHKLAKELSEILSRQSWIDSIIIPQTNIVVGNLSQPNQQMEVLESLKQQGILAVGFGAGRIRFVTHLGIPKESLDICEAAFQKIK